MAIAFGHTSQAQPIEVDVELALMVDASRSMSVGELQIQRRGYAAALTSDEVLGVILNSFTGRIAVTYVEWGGDGVNRVVLPWTLIDSKESAQEAADVLNGVIEWGLRRTSISGALLYAREEIENNNFEGLRKVIDISGDGPNNDGRPVVRTRDQIVENGIIINGLPLMTTDNTSPWGIIDLDIYYAICVIGGPGAFSIPVLTWEDFPLAVRRKLVLELAQAPGQSGFAGRSGMTDEGYDCMIGEKLRRERELLRSEP
ncbi:MAG: DUF1194 domain-containing protein [Boseongicola sp.]|nr:DUF1194 domain-containing protein [Boseongicola sp.]